jgi:hypothetical protein
MFGVGAYIQEHYEMDNTVLIRTISGSNYVGVSMLSNRSVESIWRLWSSRLDDLVKTRPWTGLYHMISMATHHTRELVEVCVDSEQRMQQHHIRIGTLDTMKTDWVTTYVDSQDYASAMLAGAFIPGLCGRLWQWHRHKRCVDGGIRLPCTPSRTSPPSSVKSLSISVLDNPSFTWYHLLWMLVAGLWSRLPHTRMQYAAGYVFARDHLVTRLDTLLTRRTQPMMLPAITGNIRWDPTQQMFLAIPVRDGN